MLERVGWGWRCAGGVLEWCCSSTSPACSSVVLTPAPASTLHPVSVRAPIRTGDPIRTEPIQTSEHFAARSPRPSALLQCNARDRDAHNAPNPTQNGQGTRKWQQKWCARTARRRFLRPIQPAARTCAQALRGFKIGRRGPHRCSACLEPRFYLSTHDRSPHCPDICAHAVRRPHADRSAQRV